MEIPSEIQNLYRRLGYHTKDPSILVAELAMIPLDTGLTVNGEKLFLSAENWEEVGCEFRKYTNLKQGKGSKRIYSK